MSDRQILFLGVAIVIGVIAFRRYQKGKDGNTKQVSQRIGINGAEGLPSFSTDGQNVLKAGIACVKGYDCA